MHPEQHIALEQDLAFWLPNWTWTPVRTTKGFESDFPGRSQAYAPHSNVHALAPGNKGKHCSKFQQIWLLPGGRISNKFLIAPL